VLSLQTLAQQIADTATQHIVEDLVDVNFGPNEPAPRVAFDEIGSRQAATAQALKALADAGLIDPDDVLKQAVRQQFGMPAVDPATAVVKPPTQPTIPGVDPNGGTDG
jgi:phage gp29-like protein